MIVAPPGSRGPRVRVRSRSAGRVSPSYGGPAAAATRTRILRTHRAMTGTRVISRFWCGEDVILNIITYIWIYRYIAYIWWIHVKEIFKKYLFYILHAHDLFIKHKKCWLVWWIPGFGLVLRLILEWKKPRKNVQKMIERVCWGVSTCDLLLNIPISNIADGQSCRKDNPWGIHNERG